MRSNRRAATARPDTPGNRAVQRGPTRPERRPARRPRSVDRGVYLAIAAGGAVGGLARWGVSVALPTQPGAIPWATLLTNVTGSFLLGALMVWVLDVWPSSRYLRPMLTAGVLGGYTTFSTFALETRGLLAAGQPARAFSYAMGSLAAGLLAISCGVVLARVLTGHPIRRRSRDLAPGGVTDEATRPGLQADGVRR